MSDNLDIEMPSNRKFGFTFGALFAVLAGFFAYRAQDIDAWAAGFVAASVCTLLVTALIPNALGPLNKGWMQIGLLLGRITSPIVLGMIFFLLFTPLALFFRVIGRDVLSIRKPYGSDSHWKAREPQASGSKGFVDPF